MIQCAVYVQHGSDGQKINKSEGEFLSSYVIARNHLVILWLARLVIFACVWSIWRSLDEPSVSDKVFLRSYPRVQIGVFNLHPYGSVYFGETKRNFETRWGEHHDSKGTSEVAKHLPDHCGHSFSRAILTHRFRKIFLRKILKGKILQNSNLIWMNKLSLKNWYCFKVELS